MNLEPEDPIAANIVATAMKLYHPGNRPHANEWTPQPNGKRFLGVSTLVQRTATEYATRVCNRVEEVDETNGFWGEQGNTMAEAHLSKLTPFRENQLRVPLTPDWELVGHCDGIIVVNQNGAIIQFDPDPEDLLVAAEHKMKDPQDPDGGGAPVDLAERQASLYATMLHDMLQSGENPTLADFAPQGAKAIIIDVTLPPPKVWGISTHFWPRNDPQAFVRAKSITPEHGATIRTYYATKAAAILNSIVAFEKGGITLADALAVPFGALAWDLGEHGLTEFKRTMTANEAGLDSESMLKVAVEHEQARAQCDNWEAARKERSATLCALLSRVNQKSIVIEEAGVEIVKVTSVSNNKGLGAHAKVTLKGTWTPERIAAIVATPKMETPPTPTSNQDGGA